MYREKAGLIKIKYSNLQYPGLFIRDPCTDPYLLFIRDPSEYAQANSFVAVFMVDFAPFSAVLMNCQLILHFFLVTNVPLQHPSVLTISRFHVLSHVQRFSVVFLSDT